VGGQDRQRAAHQDRTGRRCPAAGGGPVGAVCGPPRPGVDSAREGRGAAAGLRRGRAGPVCHRPSRARRRLRRPGRG